MAKKAAAPPPSDHSLPVSDRPIFGRDQAKRMVSDFLYILWDRATQLECETCGGSPLSAAEITASRQLLVDMNLLNDPGGNGPKFNDSEIAKMAFKDE